MQTELNLKIAAPEVTPEEVEQFVAYLRGRGWRTARQIEAEIGMDDRKVRSIAEHSDGRVLSGPGCPGYRYFDKDALPYAERAIACIESQATKMTKRAIAYRQRYHCFARQ